MQSPAEPTPPTAADITIEVSGFKYAAKRWGDPEGLPLLALHGWLDNAASYDLLAPYFPTLNFIALDMAGHGYSDHRPGQFGYPIWEDLPDLVAIADYFGWDRFVLCGHSRGAVVSTLLAAICPERIGALLLLDGFIAQPLPASGLVEQLRKAVSGSNNRISNRPQRPLFQTVAEAVASRCTAGGMDEAAARLIVQRNLQPCDGGYSWRSDPRLLGMSALKLSASQWESVLKAIHAPGLLLLAEYGIKAGAIFSDRLPLCPSLQAEIVGGSHHFHMDPEQAGQTAERINMFLANLP